MKHVIALMAGFLAGVGAFAALMYNNPFSVSQSVSPLAVTDQRVINLQYSAVPGEAIMFTNNGEAISKPNPESVAELWEATIRDTRVLVAALSDSRGNPAGVGVKFSSHSEDTRILNSEAMVDSAWHIYMPELGTLFIDQRENYWSYLRDIVVKARLNSANNWRGNWLGIMTTGPNALGTGRVIGGNGLLAGVESEVVESLSATAYSAETGPVAIDGSLTIALPRLESSQLSQRDRASTPVRQ